MTYKINDRVRVIEKETMTNQHSKQGGKFINNTPTKQKGTQVPNNTQQLIEEAVERYEKFIIEVADESKWVDGKPVFNGHKYVTLANAIKYLFVEELTTIVSKSAEMEQEQTLMKAKLATLGVITKLGFHGILRDKHLYPLNKEINNAFDGLSQKE